MRKRPDPKKPSVRDRADWFMYRPEDSLQPNAKTLAEQLALWLNGPGDKSRPEWQAEVIQKLKWNEFKGGKRRFAGSAFSPAKDDEARANISSLVMALHEVNRIAGLLKWDESPGNDLVGWRKYESTCKEVDRILERYRPRTSYRILCNRPMRTVDPFLDNSGTARWITTPRLPESGVRPFYFVEEKELDAIAGQEWRALELIRVLTNEGELGKLRRCKACQKWFAAKKSDQQHCSTACRQKTHHGTAQYKKQRAANYQRKKQLALLRERRSGRES